MYTKLSASRAYVYAVARAADAGKVSREVSRTELIPMPPRTLANIQDCAGAILLVSDHAVEVAMDAQQCFGGNGYINGESIATYMFLTVQSTRSAASSATLVSTLSARVRRRSAAASLAACSTRPSRPARRASKPAGLVGCSETQNKDRL
jgi:alkylation response protein AidB-like acyl-CoA dehydrogenase